MNFDTLTEAYLKHREEDFWAWEEVHRMVETDLNEGWKITLLLLEKAASDDDVGYIAAGPLEDLIDMHGHKTLDLIEDECKSNSRLQLALSTVGVLFYYEEFDRWYSLLCRYGFRQAPVGDCRAVIGNVMQLMRSYLAQTIGVGGYGRSIEDLLDKPLEDKRAQQILQAACYDFLRLNSKAPPEYRTPMLKESELRDRVKQSLAELESLGYRASE